MTTTGKAKPEGYVFGRPPEWTPEKKAAAIETICREMAMGRALINICQDDGMPGYSTVGAWRATDPDFQAMYAQAREEQADWHAEQIILIADTEEDAAKARNRIDARKWAASKLKPKVYGERLNLDGDLTVRTPDDQIDARIAQLVGKAGIALLAGREGAQEEEA